MICVYGVNSNVELFITVHYSALPVATNAMPYCMSNAVQGM